ncbi:37S ribosomal protein rsm18, mitochondrial [Psilocybe cubensis]|uniref:Small ribosomal subunit protein bS18m n=2 Tax=Psilocybe cubensis TaxID=181762 RepID=A0A8H7Y1C4_PSICU|nr:37S ribosomal protein rsm18, mitochondrial [Psilocybe cubensis]KAH9482799.1 37S ribosomal protein rsm18, mitochondrial [Psilocybe cubensis]
MFAASACVRHSFRRSFSSTASRKDDTMTPILTLLGNQSQKQPAKKQAQFAEPLHMFHSDQFIHPASLSYKACTSTRTHRSRVAVAPPSAVARKHDIFAQLNLDPRDFTTNHSILHEFVSEMGKIKSRRQTQLTVKSQRLLGKTIRRAKMMGIVSALSK